MPKVTHGKGSRNPVSLSVARPTSLASAKSQPPRKSNFFITINTNYAPTSDQEATRLGQDLQNAIRAAWDSEEDVQKMITFRSGAPRDFNQIKKMEVDYRPEIAPKTGYLHAHILFEITHTVDKPGIHLNIPAVLKAVKSHAKTPEVAKAAYINVHGFSSRATLRAYLAKGDIARDSEVLQEFVDSGKL